ncbi:lytic transglycosylase domain-containing protein [Cupriavidus sp. CP313]
MVLDLGSLAQECAPNTHVATLHAVVRTESGFNPFAIGVAGGRLQRQPANKAEAVATARALQAAAWNFSAGLGQVNVSNLQRYRLDLDSVFEPCQNLRASSAILGECYGRAAALVGTGQPALQRALSCYYSGNFTRGFVAEGKTSYVQRVLANAPVPATGIPAPAVQPIPVVPGSRQPRSVRPPAVPGRGAGIAGIHPTAVQADVAPVAPSVQDGSPPRAKWDAFDDF